MMPSLLLVMSIHNTDGTFCTVNLSLHSQRMHQIILKNLRHIMLKFTQPQQMRRYTVQSRIPHSINREPIAMGRIRQTLVARCRFTTLGGLLFLVGLSISERRGGDSLYAESCLQQVFVLRDTRNFGRWIITQTAKRNRL